MDINTYRRDVESRSKASALKHQIHDTIRDYRNQKGDIQYERGELFRPITKSQDIVRKTIDEKQDKLIDMLQQNQEAITNSLDTLSEDVSTQGLLPGVSRWVSSLPSSYDQLEDIGEEDGEKPDEKPTPKVFTNDEEEVIKKYGYDPTLQTLPKEENIRKDINMLSGKRRSNNSVVKRVALSDQRALRAYLTAVKTKKQSDAVYDVELVGEGIRQYRHPKRNAYKINNGQYGDMAINLPRLMNEMIVEVQNGSGQVVYQDMADKSLIDLLTKRYNPKRRYSNQAIKVFNNLNMLSNIPKHRSSGKSNLIGGQIIYSDPEDLMKRLTLLTGSRRAGNTNIALRNEVWQIIDHLLKKGIIKKTQYDLYVKNHLV